MPPFGKLPSAQPDPFAGANVQAFQNIIKTMADIETIRQNRMMESSVLSALSRGASPEELAGIVNQPIQFDEGVPGFFQRIAARYAQPSPLKSAITQGLAKETISDKFRNQFPYLTDAQLKAFGLTPEEWADIQRKKYGLIPKPSAGVDVSKETELGRGIGLGPGMLPKPKAKKRRIVTEEELDALIEEFDGDEKAVRKAAKERGLTIPK